MDRSRRVPELVARPESPCHCGHERIQRQSSGHSSPQPFDGVINPPHLYTDQTDCQDSDLLTRSRGSPVPLEARLQVSERQVTQLMREKEDAVRQVKEVTKMNTRWQKYDKEREVVVADLTSQHRRDTDRINQLETTLADQRSRSEELELRWTDARVRASERKSEVERIQGELKEVQHKLSQSDKKRIELSKRLELAQKEGAGTRSREEVERRDRKEADKDRDLYHMSKRVVDLKERVAQMERRLESQKKEMEEQTDLYTQQISICLDDFKQEKGDKERTKKENDDLKKQLKKAEDFASSLKVQITRYQHHQQKPASARVQPSTHHIHKYYGNYEQMDDSWDDGGFALQSDVVRDALYGFDETDNVGVSIAVDHSPGAAAAPMDPPPKYDDRSILGQVVASPPKCTKDGRTVVPARKIPVADLVLH